MAIMLKCSRGVLFLCNLTATYTAYGLKLFNSQCFHTYKTIYLTRLSICQSLVINMPT